MDKEKRKLPFALCHNITWILGRPNFVCGPIAHKLVRLGHKIPPKAEDEQAYVLYWLLELYMEHGAGFRTKASEILSQSVIEEEKDGGP